MRQTTVPDSKTKAKLIEATVGLLAEVGFDAVSVRDITKKAGMNVAAVNYHFGSRDVLLGMVVQRYVTAVNEERMVLLDAIERRYVREAPPVKELVDALVRPVLTLAPRDGMGEIQFFKLIGRVFGEQCGNLPSAAEEACKKTMGRFMRLFELALPGLGAEELAWRIHFVVGAMTHMLTQGEALDRLTQGLSGKPTMEDKIIRYLRFAESGMKAGHRRDTSKEAAKEAVKMGDQEAVAETARDLEQELADGQAGEGTKPAKETIKAAAKERVKATRPSPQHEFLF